MLSRQFVILLKSMFNINNLKITLKYNIRMVALKWHLVSFFSLNETWRFHNCNKYTISKNGIMNRFCWNNIFLQVKLFKGIKPRVYFFFIKSLWPSQTKILDRYCTIFLKHRNVDVQHQDFHEYIYSNKNIEVTLCT